MNPDSTIRPWLVACGQYFGANDAYLYRLPDSKSRLETEYFTYEIVKMKPNINGKIRKTEALGDYGSTRAAVQPWTAIVQISIFNSENGMAELAECCVAAVDDTDIISIFKTGKVAFKSAISISDETEMNDDRLYHKHTLMCEFNTSINYQHPKTNDRIETVDIDDAITIT